MHQDKVWKILKKEAVFNSKIFDIDKLDCYLESKKMNHHFYSINLHNWVNVFSLTRDGRVIMVRQHRIGKNIVTLEVPAGAIDDGEKPEEAAIRELAEETGYFPNKLIFLKQIAVNPAIQNNTCFFFLALDCIKNSDTRFDAAEELELVIKDRDVVFNYQYTNDIDNSLSFLAVILAKEYITKNGI